MSIGTVWITGARGFIGRHLARQLAADGAQVIGLGHGAWPAGEVAAWGLHDWMGGAVGASTLQALRARHGDPETVFHLAGGSSVGAALAAPHEDFDRTVASTAGLLEWLRQECPGTRIVAASSAAVYGAGHEGPIAESGPLRPYSPYGHHKAMMEALYRSYGTSFGVKSVVLRLFSVYGAGLRKQLLWDLCSRLEAEGGSATLGGTGEERRDWTDVRDVVRAIALAPALASADVPTLNVGSGIATPVRDIAALVVATWPALPDPRRTRFDGTSRPGDPFSLVAEPSALHALGFDWRVPVARGIADYVGWFKQRATATS
ncbi:MAG: SDR family oxidoreductase [Caldimonas sp.]